jgi:hypothetical protein
MRTIGKLCIWKLSVIPLLFLLTASAHAGVYPYPKNWPSTCPAFTATTMGFSVVEYIGQCYDMYGKLVTTGLRLQYPCPAIGNNNGALFCGRADYAANLGGMAYQTTNHSIYLPGYYDNSIFGFDPTAEAFTMTFQNYVTAGAYYAPAGNYIRNCRIQKIDAYNSVMTASCYDSLGVLRTSSINYAKCLTITPSQGFVGSNSRGNLICY